MEIWKDVIGYNGLYQISNLGRFKSLSREINDGRTNGKRKRKELIINAKTNNKYQITAVRKNGVKMNKQFHRMVAESFIPNPENKPEVNHINGIKSDNNVTNLEWVTHKENIKHSWLLGLSKPYWTGKKRDRKTIDALIKSKKGKSSNRKGIKLSEDVKLKSSKTWFKKGQIPHNKKLI